MVKAELPTSYKTHFFSMEVNLMFIMIRTLSFAGVSQRDDVIVRSFYREAG